jgi:uncharacterized SAM-binding protein YcdF (DUF218 family)
MATVSPRCRHTVIDAGAMRFLESLAEPVALIGWCLLAFVLALRFSRSRAWRGAALAAVLGSFGLFATPLGANALLWPLEQRAEQAALVCPEADALPLTLGIVLAGGVSPGPQSADDYAYLELASLRRLLVASQWQAAEPGRRLLLSGGAGDVPEAVLMGRLLERLGVPRQAIDLEAQSHTTTQNARRIADRLAGRHVGRAMLFTTAVHLPRAQRDLTAQGVETCARPLDFQHVAPLWPEHLVPQLSALQKSTAALHEYLGLLLRRPLSRAAAS